MSDNLSVVLHKVMDIRVEQREMAPEPKEGEVGNRTFVVLYVRVYYLVV